MAAYSLQLQVICVLPTGKAKHFPCASPQSPNKILIRKYPFAEVHEPIPARTALRRSTTMIQITVGPPIFSFLSYMHSTVALTDVMSHSPLMT
ncbi:hypothetical protein M434DRAFT_394822 [Hypoxylon sp. CO27-5]|nr:hypothetical protein M434DRAFT_394822 [Hypoxylon sp. CO27-5]